MDTEREETTTPTLPPRGMETSDAGRRIHALQEENFHLAREMLSLGAAVRFSISHHADEASIEAFWALYKEMRGKFGPGRVMLEQNHENIFFTVSNERPGVHYLRRRLLSLGRY